jgi:riboflavin synthase
MFTGIVEEIGVVSRVQRATKGYEITIRARVARQDVRLGDSIAVNGVCLTVTQLTTDSFTLGVSPETRSRTNLEQLREGDSVNLERSLTPTSRMGGHFVQGHIDGVGRVVAFRPEKDSLWVTIEAPPLLMRYVVPKGFIALDGVSLTVVDVGADRFTVMLVAYTQQQISLARQTVGYAVNIEVDVLGKYVEKLISHRLEQPTKLSANFLAEHGFVQGAEK